MNRPIRNKNGELEKLRRDVLDSAANRKQDIEKILQEVEGIHASWLCFPQGDECMKKMCLYVSSLSNNIDGNWKALAGSLGLTNNEIMYISEKQSCNTDFTELVLRTYSQNTTSNLHHIIKSLQKIERFDALKQLEEPLLRMVDKIKLLFASDNKAEYIDDKRSTEGTQQNAEHLIAPRNYQKHIRQMLSTALRNLPAQQTECIRQERHFTNEDTIIQQEVLLTQQNIPREITLPSPMVSRPLRSKPKTNINVFLTFASDGEAAAFRIAKHLRTAQNDREAFGVLILDENAERILGNPEILINKLFYQVNFIIPVLTVGYIKAINAKKDDNFDKISAMDSLDALYVQFIHSLMMNEYINNNCRNERFRCIIPDMDSNLQQQMFKTLRTPGYSDLTLRAWAYEKDLEKFLRRLIGLYH